MDRRDLIKFPILLLGTKQILLAQDSTGFFQKFFNNFLDFKNKEEIEKLDNAIQDNLSKSQILNVIEETKKETDIKILEEELEKIEESITPSSKKTIYTDTKNKDIYIEEKYKQAFQTLRKKLLQVQRYVGYGNYNIISFDDTLKIVKNVPNIGSFTKLELDFLESIFYYDPSNHGFYGERISRSLTDTINKKDVIKIPHTGHYLFRGNPENIYYQMQKDVGNDMILTSGVRSVMKQTKLFLDKLNSVDGNFTEASISLAPPAYTYHAIGDFDVGKKGYGYDNFTAKFALTEEFIKMRKLSYIDMRYTVNNKDGVRYEPWHVKII